MTPPPRRRVRRPIAVRCALLLALACAGGSGAEPLPEADARAALAALSGASGADARAAIERITTAGDRRFVPVFVELLRAAGAGIASPAVRDPSVQALAKLTGQSFGGDWFAWVHWLAGEDVTLPPGFVGWKGALLARIDPRFGEVLRDGLPSRIRADEIVWGGVAFEGIPSLDDPKTLPAGDATYLDPDEPVFGVALGGEARAYPLRILDWHEFSNDTVGGVPIALAYCTLCGSGIVYDRRVSDRVHDFGSSGFLYRSNKLMVDRQTRTLWNQFTGRPVLGTLADKALRLALLPSVVTRWKDWRARHPNTTVLSLETGHRRPYHPGAAYAGYFASDRTMFPVRVRDALPAKTRIFGLERDGHARAYDLADLVKARVLNDAIGDLPVVLIADDGRIQVDGQSVREGPARYDAGGSVRAYARTTHQFTAGEQPGQLHDERSRPWTLTEAALVGPADERLDRIPGILSYWFAWSAFHPRTNLHQPPGRTANPPGAARGAQAR